MTVKRASWLINILAICFILLAGSLLIYLSPKTASGSIVNPDPEAVSAVKSIFKDPQGNYTVSEEPGHERALNMVFNNAHPAEVEKTMTPMDESQAGATERTGRTLKEASAAQSAAGWVSAAVLALVFLVAVFNLLFNQAAVINPPSSMGAALKTAAVDGKTHLDKGINLKSKNGSGTNETAAAVEAVRAGEAGKGFAAAADEIRKLTEFSGEQSKITTAMLKKIKASVDNIKKSSNEVLVRFEAVNTRVNAASEQGQNIRAATKEQETGDKQILESIGRLNDIIGTVKKKAEDMTAAGGELLKETSDLMKISKETANGVNEMTGGVNQINTAVNGKQNEH